MREPVYKNKCILTIWSRGLPDQTFLFTEFDCVLKSFPQMFNLVLNGIYQLPHHDRVATIHLK